jgi:uncharacterized protein (DUF983 family)
MTWGHAITSLLLATLLICPVCRRGKMSRGFYTLRESCPNCGVVFEKNPGEVTGGMAINMVLTSIVGLGVMIWGVLFSGFDVNLVLVGIALFTVAFGLVFHRFARGLWVGFLYITGAISER